MGTWSVTRSSSVVVSGRIDGEYYLPAYLENERLLSKLETKPLPQLFHVSDGNHLSVSRHFIDSAGIPYYRGQDINDFFIENASPVRIPESIFSSGLMRRSHFCAGDVLLSIVGTIGSLSLVPPVLGDATGSCKIAILRQKGECSGALLAAFLLSKYGQLQIQRNTRGAVQMGLILKDLARIRVPILPENTRTEIKCLVEKAMAANSASRVHSREAQRRLEAELGLEELTFQKPVGYIARLSEIQASRRIDSEHYYPAFSAFKAGLPNGISLSPLSEGLEFCQRGKQPVYSETGLSVINSKHVQPNRVVIDGNRLAHATPEADLQIRFGDTLLNGTGRGTIGRAAPYLREELSVADNHVTILRSTKLDPAYLALYLNSPAGQMQVEMHQRGSSGQLELYPFDIRKFLVWDAPLGFQQEIRRLHDMAATAERDSQILLQTAKTRVEQLVKEAVES
jgi:restriction endonuclease S subunit